MNVYLCNKYKPPNSPVPCHITYLYTKEKIQNKRGYNLLLNSSLVNRSILVTLYFMLLVLLLNTLKASF